MRIKNVRPVTQDRSANGFATIARFTLEPIDGVVVYDCTVVAAPDGRHLVYGPLSKTGAQILSLASAKRCEIIEMTMLQLGINDHDKRAA